MKEEKIKYIFIVLLYKNMEDVIEFINSVNKKIQEKTKIVLVNSYYDDSTKTRAQEIAQEYDCDFINVENKGYGYGNNTGIKYAKDRYEFDYLIVSNSDIVIDEMPFDSLKQEEKNAIFAPDVTTIKGKKQNPHWVRKCEIIEYLQYKACKEKYNMIMDYFAIACLKFDRIFFNFLKKRKIIKKDRIYSAHGSFVIFSREAIDVLYPVYDEEMFLFYEEVHVANKAYLYNIPTYYVNTIKVIHKEDGSMNKEQLNRQKIAHESIIRYYENKGNI